MISSHFIIGTLLYVGTPFVIGAVFFVFADKIPLNVTIAIILSVVTLVVRPTLLFVPVFMLSLSYWVFLLGFLKLPTLLNYNRLGDYSYGFYIYAFPVQQIGAQMGMTTPMTNILFALPVTLFLAVLSWHWVEKPMLRFKVKRE